MMGVAEVETTLPEKPLAGKKLKIKILTKKPSTSSCDPSTQVLMKNCIDKSASTNNIASAGNTKLNGSILGSKRKLEGAVEFQKGKKVKMDSMAMSECNIVLRMLMQHKNGCIFNEPVNPVELNIPDYFDIIKRPMDLGTIKRKLNQKIYQEVEEFQSDVRLTFSNAMKYNPTGNWVHHVAKELMTLFDKLWKRVEAKICRQHERSKQLSFENSIDKSTHGENRKNVRHPCHVDKLPGRTVSNIGKAPEGSKDVSVKKAQLITVKIAKDGKAKVTKSSKPCKLVPDANGMPRLCEGNTCGVLPETQSFNVRPAQSARKVKCENAAYGNKVLHDELKTNKVTSSLQPSRPHPGSYGCQSDLDEEYACTTSVIPTTEGFDNMVDVPLSPSKALRAAMLKRRFADTILKAHHKTLLQPGDGTDSNKSRQGKERLERKQREDKAILEAQIRAAESAAQCKAQSELKRKREQERETARIALEKMERSVDLDDNFHIIRELEAIIGSSPLHLSFGRQDGVSYTAFDQFKNGKLRSPLERLGLFIKAEYMVGGGDDDDDGVFLEQGDWEEGEVIF